MRAPGLLVAIAAGVVSLGAATPARAEAPLDDARPWLGVRIDSLDGTGLGVAVVDVFSETPASMCGLQSGDEIVAFAGIRLQTTDELRNVVGAFRVGNEVSVDYVRGTTVHRCTTTLAAQINDPTERLHRRLVDRALPPFTLARRDDDTIVDDTTARHRVTVLALFSTSCDGCAATITDLADRLDGAAIDLYAVTDAPDAAIDAYVQRLGLTAPIARDRSQLVARYQEERDAVTILVLDHKGIVRFAASGAGPDGTHLDGAAFSAARAERALRRAR